MSALHEVVCTHCGQRHVMSVKRALEQRVMSCNCGELVRLDTDLSGANVMDDPVPHIDDLADEDDDEATRLISTAPRKLTLSSLGSNPNASSALRDVRWFVNLKASHTVEMTTQEVLKARAEGEVGPDVLVWRPGMVGWQPVRNVLKAPGAEVERVQRSSPNGADDSPLPRAPRVPSRASLGPPIPSPPRAPTPTPISSTPPPPPARSTQASDPSLGIYERGVPTIDFNARAARSTTPVPPRPPGRSAAPLPPPPPARIAPARPEALAAVPVQSLPPARLAPSDARSPTMPPTRSAPRAPVPPAPAAPSSPTAAKTADAPSTPSAGAVAKSASDTTEDTAMSRARAARRRAFTLGATAAAALVLVAAGATVTRALKASKHRGDTVSVEVPNATAHTHAPAADPPVETAAAAATATATTADDAVSIENLPTADRTRDAPQRVRARSWNAQRATVSAAAAAATAHGARAADQVVLDDDTTPQRPKSAATPPDTAASQPKPAQPGATSTTASSDPGF